MPNDRLHSKDQMLAEDMRLAQLLARGRDGDAGAYHDFLTELSGRMRRQMRAQARRVDDADVEDIVQNILLSVHASRATWDAGKPVLPWAAAIARHRLADHLRQRYRKGRLSNEMLQLAETFSTSGTNNTSEELVNDMAMESALRKLSKTERRAFTLVRLRGLSLKEAAWCSGSTVAAVKVAVHRAARKLQALVWDGRL